MSLLSSNNKYDSKRNANVGSIGIKIKSNKMKDLTCKELVAIWLLTDEVARTSEKNTQQQIFHEQLSEKLWEVYEKRITKSNIMKLYPRKCDITGEGMNEGYCIEEGSMYIKYEKDLIKHLREIDPMQEECSDIFLLNDYYQNDYYYWTEWDELDDDVNYTIDGKEFINNQK